jgi:hypothetical protein
MIYMLSCIDTDMNSGSSLHLFIHMHVYEYVYAHTHSLSTYIVGRHVDWCSLLVWWSQLACTYEDTYRSTHCRSYEDTYRKYALSFIYPCTYTYTSYRLCLLSLICSVRYTLVFFFQLQRFMSTVLTTPLLTTPSSVSNRCICICM